MYTVDLYLRVRLACHVDGISEREAASNDVEGLCFEEKTNSLLMAIKGKSTIKEKKKNYTSVYRFDLDDDKIKKKSNLKIKYEEIEKKMNSKFKGNFGPSGIAIYNGKYYIISSISKAILVYDANFELEEAYELNPHQFTQPEGICFDESHMYISNEGNHNNAKLLIYDL